ncbi:MAG: hypothetical protein JWO38_5866 [Gemmataceae bacterium]|nr:hypothetical protein [Gemmataceae bacterium]
MNRGLWVGVVLLVVGCSVKKYYTPPPEQLPQPADANGVRVVIEDARPEQERQPFTGPVCLYHPSRVKPNPWDQLVNETRAVAAAMPEKPEKVEIVVTSFRLVQKDDLLAKKAATVGRPMVANPVRQSGPPDPTASGQNSSPAGSDTGPGKDSLLWGFLDGHPTGASCAVRATVRFIYPGGRDQRVNVDRIAAGQNLSGTKYYGDALEDAAKSVVRQYGIQLRQGVGLQPGG